jgi:hypothetical protein
MFTKHPWSNNLMDNLILKYFWEHAGTLANLGSTII